MILMTRKPRIVDAYWRFPRKQTDGQRATDQIGGFCHSPKLHLPSGVV